MLRIKLRRAGKKNQPFFKMVVIERKSPPKGGRPVEVVGFYNPLTKERGLEEEKIKHWLSIGAQPSDAVHNMLITAGIIKGDKIDVRKKAKAGEESAQAANKAVLAGVEAETQKAGVEEPTGKPAEELKPEEQEKLKSEEKEKSIDKGE